MNDFDKKHQSILIDHNTLASLSGRIKVDPLKYCLHYPKVLLILLGIIILTQASGLYFASIAHNTQLSILISIVVIIFCFRIYWKHIKAIGYHGDLCACKVVSVNPLRVAVFTDLSMCSKKYFVIKITKPPIRRLFDGKPLKINDKLASVALYQAAPMNDERWATFDPKPVQCFSFDKEQASNAMARIPQELWDNLDQGIEEIGDSSKILGLYHFSE